MSKLTKKKGLSVHKYWFRKSFCGAFNDQVIFRYHRLFFGSLITHGKKLSALTFLINLKYVLKRKLSIDPNFIIYSSLLKITPYLLLKPKKIGSSVYGVPMYISLRNQITFSVKWVIKLLKDKYRIFTLSNVSDVLLSALVNKGDSYNNKLEFYQQADRNRHLIRYIR